MCGKYSEFLDSLEDVASNKISPSDLFVKILPPQSPWLESTFEKCFRPYVLHISSCRKCSSRLRVVKKKISRQYCRLRDSKKPGDRKKAEDYFVLMLSLDTPYLSKIYNKYSNSVPNVEDSIWSICVEPMSKFNPQIATTPATFCARPIQWHINKIRRTQNKQIPAVPISYIEEQKEKRNQPYRDPADDSPSIENEVADALDNITLRIDVIERIHALAVELVTNKVRLTPLQRKIVSQILQINPNNIDLNAIEDIEDLYEKAEFLAKKHPHIAKKIFEGLQEVV